jgi:hydrogenase/urease accessory protein HupE
MVSCRRLPRLTRLVVLITLALPVFAHPQSGVTLGFKSGFLHPLSGLDHILAMVSVGIWGSQLGKPALWLLPVTFPLVMALGGVLGVRGVPLPGVEVGVALSAVVLGLMIALCARPRLWIAAMVVGMFAIFHGYAHGKELPHAAQPLAFGMAFVLTTGMLPLPLSERIDAADRFLTATGAAINHGGNSAFYAPSRDIIQLPPFEAFRDKESYYATALHELTHWTKHDTRLDRDFGRQKFGDAGYAREELVAELGAAFLCAEIGITPEIRADHADYIGHWLQVLKEDKRAIFSAAAHPQRAADFLNGLQPEPAA